MRDCVIRISCYQVADIDWLMISPQVDVAILFPALYLYIQIPFHLRTVLSHFSISYSMCKGDSLTDLFLSARSLQKLHELLTSSLSATNFFLFFYFLFALISASASALSKTEEVAKKKKKMFALVVEFANVNRSGDPGRILFPKKVMHFLNF